MKNKLKYIFVLVLCLVLAISPKVNAAYTFFEGPSTNVPWVFVWSNGYRRGPTVTSIFKLRGDAGDVRDTFCIQSIIHTDLNVQYTTVYTPPQVLSVGTRISAGYYPENTAEHYWNDILSAETKRSMNIAYVWWKTYHPNESGAAAATQMFLWSQTQGNAGQYLEDHISPGYRIEYNQPPNEINDGYNFLNREKVWEYTYNPSAIFTRDGSVPNTSEAATQTALNYYDELVSYYQNFTNDVPTMVLESGNEILHPGESVTYVDSKHVLNKAEWSVDYDLPNGITANKDGDRITFTASADYKGTTYPKATFTRYKGTNNGGYARVYSNGTGNQILFEGGLPNLTSELQIKATSIKIKLAKHGEEPKPQGDAKLDQAKYRIWSEDTGFDETVTIAKDTDGLYSFTTNWVEPGMYYVQETFAPEGYVLDETVYEVEVKPEHSEQVVVVQNVYEKVKKYCLDVFKFVDNYDGSEEISAAGAKLRLTLESDDSYYIDLTLDEMGSGIFVEEQYMDEYPYTIPYGKYVLTEIAETEPEAKTDYYIQPKVIDFTLEENHKTEFIIEDDYPIEACLEVSKIDKKTNKEIKLPGAIFKIWNVEKGEWVKSKVYPSGEYIEEYVTNDEGKFVTQAKLKAGDYVLYELKAPEGYYLEDDLRLPSDPSKYGVEGGMKVRIDKSSLGLRDDVEYDGTVQLGDLVYKAVVEENPLLVSLTLHKIGEKLDASRTKVFTYEDKNVNKEIELEGEEPVYRKVGLEGVTYGLYAAEEIIDTNGEHHADKDQLIEEITTDADGYASTTVDIWPGNYYLKELEAPLGYVISDEVYNVKLENKDENVDVKNYSFELSDLRQKVNFKFLKLFKESKFAEEDQIKHAVFGVYTKENINNYSNNLTIPADTLVDLIEVNDNGEVVNGADLPVGKYYVKEIYSIFPYTPSDEIIEIEIKYSTDKTLKEYVIDTGVQIDNTELLGKVTFLKISKSIDDCTVLQGKNFDEDVLDKKETEIIQELKAKSHDELVEYYKDEGIRLIPGIEFEIWKTEDGSEKLTLVNPETGEREVAKFSTDNLGLIEIDEIPIGNYYLKETKIPEDTVYEISDDVIPFTITANNLDDRLYQVVYNGPEVATIFHKTDVFTGEDVPNCEFIIKDSEGNILIHSITDEDGCGWIPDDIFVDGETYTYTEIDAPSVYKKDGRLYELNTEPHEFVAHLDENRKWTGDLIEVQNYRPLTQVKLIKTDEEDNLVPNCKFELKSVEEGLFYETGVTDENGIYVFENVPQGEYIYTELEAPEEYQIDTTPHEIYVTGDEIVIDFVNKKAPDTGDIPVIALAILGVICVAGIAYVVVRKVKASKKA